MDIRKNMILFFLFVIALMALTGHVSHWTFIQVPQFYPQPGFWRIVVSFFDFLALACVVGIGLPIAILSVGDAGEMDDYFEDWGERTGGVLCLIVAYSLLYCTARMVIYLTYTVILRDLF